jgi:CBS domain-containing protein
MPGCTSSSQNVRRQEPSHVSRREPVPLVSDADLINPLLRVADVMTKDAATCKASTPLVEALRVLRQSGAGAVPVVERGRPLGFLTDRCVIAVLYDRPGDWDLLTVADVLERGPSPVGADDRLDAIFEHFGCGGMLVADDDGNFIGVVGWKDLPGHVSERGLGRLAKRFFERMPGRNG